MNKRLAISTMLGIILGMTAMETEAHSREYSSVEKEMLETFCDYARINSQSRYPADGTAEFTMTPGQEKMATRLYNDIESAIKAGNVKCNLHRSSDNYVYLTIPSNCSADVPSIGISCHLDVTPEVDFGDKPIVPIVEKRAEGTIIRTDGTTLLGADDKCGCAIAMMLIRTILSDASVKHGELQFVFCPNEDIGLAAERIEPEYFSPEMLFDIDGEESLMITDSNFTARGLNLLFKGNSVHPSEAKEKGLGDAVAAASTFIANIPVQYRPEHSEGKEGYIHPWNITRKGNDVLVETRVRYFDAEDGEFFDTVLKKACLKAVTDFDNVDVKVVYDGIQYQNVAYTLHPKAHDLVDRALDKLGMPAEYIASRGGTTAAMFASKGLNGGMCVFSGQHNPHSLKEYASLEEMVDAYKLLITIIQENTL